MINNKKLAVKLAEQIIKENKIDLHNIQSDEIVKIALELYNSNLINFYLTEMEDKYGVFVEARILIKEFNKNIVFDNDFYIGDEAEDVNEIVDGLFELNENVNQFLSKHKLSI